MEMHE
jgi:hypothetical protein